MGMIDLASAFPLSNQAATEVLGLCEKINVIFKETGFPPLPCILHGICLPFVPCCMMASYKSKRYSRTDSEKFLLTSLECRARPNLPEIHLFWTSTWGEEDRVLVDLDPLAVCGGPHSITLSAKYFGGYL